MIYRGEEKMLTSQEQVEQMNEWGDRLSHCRTRMSVIAREMSEIVAQINDRADDIQHDIDTGKTKSEG
jgi:hypothetical protein